MRTTIFLSLIYAITMSSTAYGQFETRNITLASHLSLSQIGGGGGNDIWGWTDSQTGREYALFGRSTGTSFVDVSDPFNPQYLGNLPTHSGSSPWRDIKVYQDHAYIVSDNNGPHGLQIFDLTNLRGVATPQTFAETAHYDGFRSAHNIAINEDTGFAYVISSNVSAGLHMLDISNPTQPVFVGNTGFSAHDDQIVTYHGPDERFTGREIMFGSHEARFAIRDLTDKQNSTVLGFGTFPGAVYLHQGWLSEDQRFFYQNDELDSQWTHIWDVADLTDPQYLGFIPPTRSSIDHNLYVKGDYIYEANYTSGLRVFDAVDPEHLVLTEVAHIDTFPQGDFFGFDGAWSVYPYFESGTVIVSDISSGLFVVRLDLFDGDFDFDGDLDTADIDQLTSAIASGNFDEQFDLTGDGDLDLDDRDLWLAQAGEENLASGAPYLLGDANLDGFVDGPDFISWNTNKFTDVALWTHGDFNADGTVDGQDFNAWNANKFTSASPPSAVPEPAAATILLGLAIAAVARRKTPGS